jgi:hypothetical protein
MIRLSPKELDRLIYLWEHHRRRCETKADSTIEQSAASGIGTNSFLVCGCGEKFDITDYLSW